MVTFPELESSVACARAGDGGSGDVVFDGDRVSVWGGEEFHGWMEVR